MKNYFAIAFIFIINFLNAQVQNQYQAIDLKMDKIPVELEKSTNQVAKYISDNFSTDDAKSRAAFYWTASTIRYDVENMFNQLPNQTSQEKIDVALTSKKGVCMHYAEVFSDIMNKLNITTVVVEGYTKENTKIAEIGHVWCASKIDNKWYLFDPTWGSGYVLNKKYVKKITNKYYKAVPNTFLTTHMAFDYLWQFSEYPISNQEFYDGKIISENKKVKFDYLNEVERYMKLSMADKDFESAKRVEKNGIKNTLISEYLKIKKGNFQVTIQNNNIEKINQVIADYNEGVRMLNDFVEYRNHRFIPKMSDFEIKDMITRAKVKLTKCQDDVFNVGTVGNENMSNLLSLKRAIIASVSQVKEHDDFVDDYLSKGTLKRKSMFYKTSIFGIPLK